MHRSSEWLLLIRLFNRNFICISHLPHACCMAFSSHPPCNDHPNNIWWRVQIMKLSFCSFLQPPIVLSLLGPNILCRNLSLCYLEVAVEQIFWPDTCGFCDISTLIHYRYSYAGLIILHMWQVYFFMILNKVFSTFKTWDHFHSFLTHRLLNKWGSFIGISWQCFKRTTNLQWKQFHILLNFYK
jgi:hypothetical protein